MGNSQLVALEDVAGIDFVSHIVEDGIVAVGDDGLGEEFELGEVVNNEAAEEGATIWQCRFVDDDLGTFGFHTLHDTLDR